MVHILDIPELGKLEIIEIYEYYDQPVLFSCKNAAGHLYLVVAADEDEFCLTWLCVAVSVERLNLIRSGTIDLHDAFAEPENTYVIQVKVPYQEHDSVKLDSIVSHKIPEEMLPLPGERLDLNLESQVQFTVTGALIGVFLRTKTFEIKTSEKTYNGYITDEAIETVRNATLSQEYTAVIQEITQSKLATDNITNPTYLLLSLRR